MLQPNWFVALPLPPQARWQEAADTAPGDWRRLAPEDLHLTVAFLGPCGELRAMAAWQALADLQPGPITVTAGGWRGLGPPQRPSCFGLTLAAGHATLGSLIQRWDPLARQAAGLPPTSRSALPHVTLLRVPRRRGLDGEPAQCRWIEQAPLPERPARLQELALWSWDPQRQQRLFRIVERRPLG